MLHLHPWQFLIRPKGQLAKVTIPYLTPNALVTFISQSWCCCHRRMRMLGFGGGTQPSLDPSYSPAWARQDPAPHGGPIGVCWVLGSVGTAHTGKGPVPAQGAEGGKTGGEKKKKRVLSYLSPVFSPSHHKHLLRVLPWKGWLFFFPPSLPPPLHSSAL